MFEPHKAVQLTILFKSPDYLNMIYGLLGTFEEYLLSPNFVIRSIYVII